MLTLTYRPAHIRSSRLLLLVSLVTCLLVTYSNCYHGDYVNQFTAYVNGGKSEADAVVSHLQKRSAHVINTIISSKHGYVIHFSHADIHSRSKRSSESHESIMDLTNHPHIRSVEQQTELIRDKRDFNSLDQIEKARRLVKEYLDLIKSEESTAAQHHSGSAETKIQHDKQRELEEPLFYEDKAVYKRYKMAESPSISGHTQVSLENREYDPTEQREINLNDEHWKDQWYLNNLGQAGGPKGLDINVVPAWQQGFSGRNISVCVLDDGVEHTHDDLKNNYWNEISTDFNSETDSDPMPNPKNLDENSHGTRCAGEIAATANNSVCGVGVAFNCRIGGVRILDGTVTDALEADALLFNNQVVDIYSASWGPRDDGKTMEAPGKHCEAALEQGAKEGRNGKGSIFVWATGNGGYNGDDCAADGYVSSPYTLSIGSINNYAESTYFMEWCPSTLAVIYTGGFHTRADALSNDELSHPILKIVTTDVRNKCTLNFQGTSSAAPLAAGVMALALEANPALTWRDIQHIVVLTSKVPNSIERGWTINGAGLHINDKFGYGTLDAAQMVQVAQSWNNVGPQHTCVVSPSSQTQRIFSSTEPLQVTMETDGCQKTSSSVKDHQVDKLEHVQLHVKLDTARRGNIKLTLISPAGTRSEMLSPRRNDDSPDGIHFTFMTVRCWNEIPRGSWTLIVVDTNKTSGLPSVFYSWSLTLLGTVHSTATRDAGSDKKAYNPDQETLDNLMNIESDAAVNVKIKKGSESDVIQEFASNKPNADADSSSKADLTIGGTEQKTQSTSASGVDTKLEKNIANLIDGMPREKVEHMIVKLKQEVIVAKRVREEQQDQELLEKLKEFLEDN